MYLLIRAFLISRLSLAAKNLALHVTEADIRAGRLVSAGSALKIVANKATGK
jgi:hypothetical protein